MMAKHFKDVSTSEGSLQNLMPVITQPNNQQELCIFSQFWKPVRGFEIF